jgi:hypothetical protein
VGQRETALQRELLPVTPVRMSASRCIAAE